MERFLIALVYVSTSVSLYKFRLLGPSDSYIEAFANLFLVTVATGLLVAVGTVVWHAPPGIRAWRRRRRDTVPRPLYQWQQQKIASLSRDVESLRAEVAQYDQELQAVVATWAPLPIAPTTVLTSRHDAAKKVNRLSFVDVENASTADSLKATRTESETDQESIPAI